MIAEKILLNKLYNYIDENNNKLLISKVAENKNYSILLDSNLNVFLCFQDKPIITLEVDQEFGKASTELIEEVANRDDFTEALLNSIIINYNKEHYKEIIYEDNELIIKNSYIGKPKIYLAGDLLFDLDTCITNSPQIIQYTLGSNKGLELIPLRSTINNKASNTYEKVNSYSWFNRIIVSGKFSVLDLLSKDKFNWSGRGEWCSYSPISLVGYFGEVPVYKIASKWVSDWDSPVEGDIWTLKPTLSKLSYLIEKLGLRVSNGFVEVVDIENTMVTYYRAGDDLLLYDANIVLRESK